MGIPVKLKNVIICYPHLFTKHAAPGTENAKYSAEFLLDPVAHAAVLQELQRAFEQVVTEAGKASNLQYLKSPVKNGDEVNAAKLAKGQNAREELVGKFLIRASDPTTAPAVINASMQPLSEAQQSQIFGGCVVNAYIDLYWSPNAANPGCYVGLKGVQLIDNVNVTPLGGGRPSVEQMFEPVKGAPDPVQPAEDKGPAPGSDLPSFM